MTHPTQELERLRVRMTPGEQTRAIIQEVADKHEVHIRDIMGRSHLRCFAWPRQEAMYELANRSKWMSLPAIGRALGRDHTTVIWGIRAHCKRIGVSYEELSARRDGSFWLTPSAFAGYGEAMRAHKLRPALAVAKRVSGPEKKPRPRGVEPSDVRRFSWEM